MTSTKPLPIADPTSIIYPTLNNAYLLLVEDNLINQEFMPEILANEGIQVDIANNGLEAITMVRQKDYSAVLMDCHMPVMDGFEASRQIRSDPRFATLPIIAMTANVMPADIERCLASGMNDHIGKPLDWDPFFKTLERWVKPRVESSIITDVTIANTVPEFPQLTGVDLAFVKKQTGNNVVVYKKMLSLFCANHADDISLIRTAYQAGAKETANLIAHKLKGSAASMAQAHLSDLTVELELVLQQHDNTMIEAALKKTELTLALLINEINLILPKPDL